MYSMELKDEEIIEPRAAVAAGGATPPTDEDNVIKWSSRAEWLFLLEARAYVEANPDDVYNRLVYKNLLRAYRSGY